MAGWCLPVTSSQVDMACSGQHPQNISLGTVRGPLLLSRKDGLKYIECFECILSIWMTWTSGFSPCFSVYFCMPCSDRLHAPYSLRMPLALLKLIPFAAPPNRCHLRRYSKIFSWREIERLMSWNICAAVDVSSVSETRYSLEWPCIPSVYPKFSTP
jgi:hypothetical protein